MSGAHEVTLSLCPFCIVCSVFLGIFSNSSSSCLDSPKLEDGYGGVHHIHGEIIINHAPQGVLMAYGVLGLTILLLTILIPLFMLIRFIDIQFDAIINLEN